MSQTLRTIIDELQRQTDTSRYRWLGCFDPTDPSNALIDGDVDLTALADAIDNQTKVQTIEELQRKVTVLTQVTGYLLDALKYDVRDGATGPDQHALKTARQNFIDGLLGHGEPRPAPPSDWNGKL